MANANLMSGALQITKYGSASGGNVVKIAHSPGKIAFNRASNSSSKVIEGATSIVNNSSSKVYRSGMTTTKIVNNLDSDANTINVTTGTITTTDQLRDQLETKIRGLSGDSAANVFYQFRILGNSLGKTMIFENFVKAILKMGIRAEQNTMYSLFQSMANGASKLTLEAFSRVFSHAISEEGTEIVRHYWVNGGMLETIKQELGQIEQGLSKLLRALSRFKTNGQNITFNDFCQALEKVNIRAKRSDIEMAFKQIDHEENGSVTYSQFVRRFGTVKAVVKTEAKISSLEQLQAALQTKIKTLSGSPAKVFFQFRMLGGASDDGMTMENFMQALLKWGIQADQDVIYGFFQSLANGATLITFDGFASTLMPTRYQRSIPKVVNNSSSQMIEGHSIQTKIVDNSTTSVNTSSITQLRAQLETQIRSLSGDTAAKVFYQFRILGDSFGKTMTFDNFVRAISKMGISDNQDDIRSLFQSIVRGARTLTLKIFRREFSNAISEEGTEVIRHYWVNGGVLETIKQKLREMDEGQRMLITALSRFNKYGKVIRFNDFYLALQKVNIQMSRPDLEKAFSQLDHETNGSVTYDQLMRRMFGSERIDYLTDEKPEKPKKITSLDQLQFAIEGHVKDVKVDPSQVLKRFNLDGMTLEHFIMTLEKLGIHADRSVVINLYRSLVKGESSLTKKVVDTKLIKNIGMTMNESRVDHVHYIKQAKAIERANLIDVTIEKREKPVFYLYKNSLTLGEDWTRRRAQERAGRVDR